MNTSITGHMIVRNEDQFVWYSLNSILPYVGKCIVYDTGSSDKTVAIINSINSPKIIFSQKGPVDKIGLVNLRNQQIKETDTEWIWIVDGDEIYPTKTADSVAASSHDPNIVGIIVHRYDLLGDIYHYQSEEVGAYQQFEKKGHYVLRLINKKHIPNLRVIGIYPNEVYVNKKGISVKEFGRKRFAFVEDRIFHAMYLKRSSKGAVLNDTLHRKKWKIETGRAISVDKLPAIFFGDRPEIVPKVTQKRSLLYALEALGVTPLKKIKRVIIHQ